MHRRQGFTVIELLVVLGIIALILGITVPQLNRSAEGTKLKTTAETIKELLETAKSIAMAQGTTCALVYDAGTRALSLMKTDTDDANRNGDTAEMIAFDKAIPVPSGLTVYLTADDSVAFNSTGGVVSPDDAITVTSQALKKQKQITVNQTTGYIKVT